MRENGKTDFVWDLWLSGLYTGIPASNPGLDPGQKLVFFLFFGLCFMKSYLTKSLFIGTAHPKISWCSLPAAMQCACLLLFSSMLLCSTAVSLCCSNPRLSTREATVRHLLGTHYVFMPYTAGPLGANV